METLSCKNLADGRMVIHSNQNDDLLAPARALIRQDALFFLKKSIGAVPDRAVFSISP